MIPTYNNEQTVARVAREVQKVLGHVIVVNDGSGPPCTRVLEDLAGEPGIEVVHRPHNGGKGSAVKDGLGRAAELGFSHVLQVDADGQHDLGDLERFVEAARHAPDALVLGTPEFDASVPKLRLYARQITTFFCALETFGRVIRDPMCGFRVYPLALARRAKVRGNYMDFDPEIAVKLVWQGARVVNLGTRVRYLAPEEGGVSSFKMLEDNLRISWMHTRLVLGACLRLLIWPWFVRQRRLQGSAWHRIPEAGNTLGIRFLAGTARVLGRTPVRLLLLFVVFYYTLVKAGARRASRDYLERVGAPSGFWAVYKHLLCFAECSLDRWYLVAGDLERFQIVRYGHEYLSEMSRAGRGALLLGAHLGSFEALRALERVSDDVTIHVMGYFENSRMLNRELDRAPANRSQFLSLAPGELGPLFRAKELIEAGQFVALLADRAGLGPSVEVEFLGKPARFPVGAYAMAAALECPVLLTMGLYFRPNRYELYCEPFLDRVPKRREDPEGFERAARAFAERLEHYCRLAPDNWFNFYDFWNDRTSD